MNRTLWSALLVAFAACSAQDGEDAPLLSPPPAGQGFQLGTPVYDVAPGTEDQRCYFFEAPDTETYVGRIQAALRGGSHHFNVFRVRTIHELDGKPGDVVVDGPCRESSNWSDWPLVTNLQDSNGPGVSDWTLPGGVAQRFEPHEKLMLQAHYVNATLQKTPDRAQAVVNFWKVDGSSVHDEMGTLFATNQNIKICPGDQDRYFTASCTINGTEGGSGPTTIVAANGHFHSRGTLFQMTVLDALGNPAPAPFYESNAWDDPLHARGLNVVVPPGGSVSFTCHYTMRPDQCGNPENSCCSTFGFGAEQQEHCNAFVYYYPRTADIKCF